jgi:N-methylhydantoinase A
MYDPVDGATSAATIVERDELQVGATVAGPALIVESQTTTVLGASHRAVVQTDGSLRISREQEVSA